MLTVDNLLVVDRVIEFGVRYVQDGVVPQEFFAVCENEFLAGKRAKALNGQVVQRTIFTTKWETAGLEA